MQECVRMREKDEWDGEFACNRNLNKHLKKEYLENFEGHKEFTAQ